MDNSKKSESTESEKTEIVVYKRSEQAQKIIDVMDLVYERLIAFKKRMKTDAVISRNGKIVRIKIE
jgi:hypothetical protein